MRPPCLAFCFTDPLFIWTLQGGHRRSAVRLQVLGRSGRLLGFWIDFYVCRCYMYLFIKPESFLCGYLVMHFALQILSSSWVGHSILLLGSWSTVVLKQILERSSRLPRSWLQPHVCRCMFACASLCLGSGAGYNVIQLATSSSAAQCLQCH